MATPTRFNTLNLEGVDVNNVYTVSASVTPETPAPPFLVGTECIGTGGSQFIFVQASTSVSANDFVCITGAATANSLTTTNIVSSLGVRIGVAPGSPVVTSTGIPAGTYFWAQINGSGVLGNGTGSSQSVGLYSSATAGVVTSVSSVGSQLGGVAVMASNTVNPQTFVLSWPRVVSATDNNP